MSKNIYKVAGVAVLAALCAPMISAQGYSPATVELLKEQRLWFHTTNAAGAILDNTQNYSEVRLGYDNTAGNFHRPQEGKSVSNAGVDCEGFMNLNTALVWGEFSFKQRNINESQFNASIADPFRGMPFFYADEHLSDWRNQYYNMKFRASTPLYWGKFAAGIEGVYRATIAAKQLDPRVDTRYFELGLKPGVVYSIDGHNSIGADFQYTAIKEDSRMQNVNATVPQTYYLLYGLGMASKQIGDGNRTDYHGHILGGGLQYNFQTRGFNALLSGDYSRRVENVDNNPTVPEKKTSVKDDIWTVKLMLQHTGENWGNRLTLGTNLRDLKGIQYLSEFDNNETNPGWNVINYNVRSTYKTTALSAYYSIIRYRADEYAWRVDAGVMYNKQKDRYILPEARKDYDGVYTHITGKYNFKLGSKMNRRLLVSATAGVMMAGDGEYYHSDAMPDYPTISVLETGDIQYFSSDYWNAGASATYSQQIKSDNRMNCYARAEFNYVKTNDYGFNHRRYMSFALGFTF